MSFRIYVFVIVIRLHRSAGIQRVSVQGNGRHRFANCTFRLVYHVLDRTPWRIYRQLTTGPRNRRIFAHLRPFHSVRFGDDRSSRVKASFLSVRVRSQLTKSAIRARFRLLSLPVHQRYRYDLVTSRANEVSFGTLRKPLSQGCSQLPIPPILFLFVGANDELFVRRPHPIWK